MKLDPVQIEALRLGEEARKRGQSGYGYLLEQGLGKTALTCAESLELFCQDKIDCIVVVTVNSFKQGWVEDILKHEFPIYAHVFESGADTTNEWFLRKKNPNGNLRAIIVNYEAVRSEKTQDYIHRFVAGRKAAIYFDESIQISTHDSSQTKACISLAKEFVWRVVLSGKWMKSGPHDLWSQLRTIGALDGVNYFHFRGHFCKMGGFKGKAIVGARNEEDLANTINPWVFQAKKADWGINIGKRYTSRDYKMVPEQLEHFTSMYEDFVAFISDDEVVSVDAAITKYIKMMQIQSGFIIDAEGKVRELVPLKKNPRINSMLEFIDTELTGKLCIPYHHKHVGMMLMEALTHLRPAFIMGGMKPEDIEAQKAIFNSDPKCRVILLQTRAAKYGHTLLGHGADVDRCYSMYFFENTYSLDDRSQIEDRIHRRGQTNDYCGYIDSSATIIDRNMTAALQRKDDIYTSIMKLVKGG